MDAPAGPAGPCGPGGPCGPAGSAPEAKSEACREPFLMSELVIVLLAIFDDVTAPLRIFELVTAPFLIWLVVICEAASAVPPETARNSASDDATFAYVSRDRILRKRN